MESYARYPISIVNEVHVLVEHTRHHKFESLNVDNNNMPVVGTVLESINPCLYIAIKSCY